MTRADWAILVLTLGLLPLLYANYWGARTQGDSVRIMVGEEQYAVVSLADDRTLEVPGRLGPSQIEIKGGQIHFLDSPCRGKQCVHSGWLHLGGEFAACLPNRVSLTILSSESRFDSINF